MDASDVGSWMRDQTFDKALAVDLSPSGRFLIKDFYGVGGVPAGRGGAVLSRSHAARRENEKSPAPSRPVMNV